MRQAGYGPAARRTGKASGFAGAGAFAEARLAKAATGRNKAGAAFGFSGLFQPTMHHRPNRVQAMRQDIPNEG